MPNGIPTVLVLAGGPDAERDVSLLSAAAIAEGLRASGRFRVNHQVIGRATGAEIRAMEGDVIWPALHGKWGEGGPAQDLLEADGRPYVGCRPRAARLAMDKVASKFIAQAAGARCATTAVMDPKDDGCPLPFPVVLKPIFEGSTIGLFIVKSAAQWPAARSAAAASGKPYMIEPYIKGIELTAGMIDRGEQEGGTGRGQAGDGKRVAHAARLSSLPLIRITPAEGLYDYEAKYTREDTRYEVNPALPPEVTHQIGEVTGRLAQAMGVRHLCRADFILDDQGMAWFLEVNTMPGFTSHSLVPMAARAAGLEMPTLCALLVERALAEGGSSPGS